MNRALIEIASWSLASELTRRFPHRFRIIETHPGDGQYDCLTIVEGVRHICDFNREGQFHPSGDQPPIDVWDLLEHGENPKHLLDRLCAALAISVPQFLPPCSPPILIYRLIAAHLRNTVFTPDTWSCINGFLDTSGWSSSVRDECFSVFPEAQRRQRIREDSDLSNQPAYRFWFLCRNNVPLLCFETNGTAITRKGEHIDLAALYKTKRSLIQLLAALEPELV